MKSKTKKWKTNPWSGLSLWLQDSHKCSLLVWNCDCNWGLCKIKLGLSHVVLTWRHFPGSFTCGVNMTPLPSAILVLVSAFPSRHAGVAWTIFRWGVWGRIHYPFSYVSACRLFIHYPTVMQFMIFLVVVQASDNFDLSVEQHSYVYSMANDVLDFGFLARLNWKHKAKHKQDIIKTWHPVRPRSCSVVTPLGGTVWVYLRLYLGLLFVMHWLFNYFLSWGLVTFTEAVGWTHPWWHCACSSEGKFAWSSICTLAHTCLPLTIFLIVQVTRRASSILQLRCNSERDPAAQRFLKMNHDLPLQPLGTFLTFIFISGSCRSDSHHVSIIEHIKSGVVIRSKTDMFQKDRSSYVKKACLSHHDTFCENVWLTWSPGVNVSAVELAGWALRGGISLQAFLGLAHP